MHAAAPAPPPAPAPEPDLSGIGPGALAMVAAVRGAGRLAGWRAVGAIRFLLAQLVVVMALGIERKLRLEVFAGEARPRPKRRRQREKELERERRRSGGAGGCGREGGKGRNPATGEGARGGVGAHARLTGWSGIGATGREVSHSAPAAASGAAAARADADTADIRPSADGAPDPLAAVEPLSAARLLPPSRMLFWAGERFDGSEFAFAAPGWRSAPPPGLWADPADPWTPPADDADALTRPTNCEHDPDPAALRRAQLLEGALLGLEAIARDPLPRARALAHYLARRHCGPVRMRPGPPLPGDPHDAPFHPPGLPSEAALAARIAALSKGRPPWAGPRYPPQSTLRITQL